MNSWWLTVVWREDEDEVAIFIMRLALVLVLEGAVMFNLQWC